MAYDAQKAHEYYMKYRKKGLKKGRKTGTRKKSSSQKKESLVGLSTGGLNDSGKMAWAMKKKELQNQMNVDLAKARTPEERAKIQNDYQSKALAELQKMKSDPSTAKAKKASTGSRGSAGSRTSASSKSPAKKSAKSTKSNNFKGVASSYVKSGSGGSQSRGRTIKNDPSAPPSRKKKVESPEKAAMKREYANQKAEIENQIKALKAQLSKMTDEQKAELKAQLQAQIAELKNQLAEKKQEMDQKLRNM
jgi:hypothetical protein